ncbi:uncharacterized protein LOC134530647 [Bacillus rossius redtenbacheri]|uniref:uncharacterized protein LOC134530647 n=1 Tax=Bacillus rossius redtenbacheri TaxID=93214 RepID=UPI002FDDA5A0
MLAILWAVASLLANGLSEWVQLPVMERIEHSQTPSWPGKYFRHAANNSRRLSRPTPPAAFRGTTTTSPPSKAVPVISPPTTRQHPILVLAYNGKTPRVQFVRPAIFVGNRTASPVPDTDRQQAKGADAGSGLFGLAENPLDVLRKVHQSLKMQTPRSILAKLKFLHDLRENLLFYVDQYLKSMWGPGKRRKARQALQRPSIEGGLMSMSFLMFGVFTVQLVQKVINNLSGGGARGRRQRRSVDDILASAKIVSFMEQYPMELQEN